MKTFLSGFVSNFLSNLGLLPLMSEAKGEQVKNSDGEKCHKGERIRVDIVTEAKRQRMMLTMEI